MTVNFLNSLAGLSSGYRHSILSAKEAEVRQGKNYYMASFCQAIEVVQFSTDANFLIQKLPSSIFKTALRITSFVFSVSGFIVFPFFAAVKEGHYETVSRFWNENAPTVLTNLHTSAPRLPNLPLSLSKRVKTACHFMAENSGHILRALGVITSIAITILYPYYGAAMLLGTAYAVADSKGVIPRKVSLFVETYFSVFLKAGGLIYGNPLVRIFIIGQIATSTSSFANRFLHHKASYIAQKYLMPKMGISTTLPVLEEFDAPITNNKNMSFEEIRALLSNNYTLKVDPSHCSKEAIEDISLPEDHNFDNLLTHFNRVNWEEKYDLIQKKLADDERFIDFLSEKFPEKEKKTLKNREIFNSCMMQLAQAEGLTIQRYAATLMLNQMEVLVGTLKGEMRVKGQQTDLDAAIKNIAKIIPYLMDLREKGDLIAFEDCLLKLTVEAGEFCARGLKRASTEIVDSMVTGIKISTAGEHREYEMKIRGALQEKRLQIIQMTYQEMMPAMNQMTQDVHTFDIYRSVLSVGFYPLTDIERQQTVSTVFLLNPRFTQVRESMFGGYQETVDSTVEEIVQEMGAIHLSAYARQLINSNRALSATQQEELIELLTNAWDSDLKKKLRNFVLVSLGVLKKLPHF